MHRSSAHLSQFLDCASDIERRSAKSSVRVHQQEHIANIRLAFATATDIAPDILLIDEILSVGDSEFQEKSRNRMREQINSGSAAVLVTHDMWAVREMADRVLWLENGSLKMLGNPEEVVSAYENF